MRWMVAMTLALALAGSAACAGSDAYEDRRQPSLERVSDEKFASPQECTRAVQRLYDLRAQDPLIDAEDKELFDRTEHNVYMQERVRRCTISLSKRDAACLAMSRDVLEVQNCQRFY